MTRPFLFFLIFFLLYFSSLSLSLIFLFNLPLFPLHYPNVAQSSLFLFFFMPKKNNNFHKFAAVDLFPTDKKGIVLLFFCAHFVAFELWIQSDRFQYLETATHWFSFTHQVYSLLQPTSYFICCLYIWYIYIYKYYSLRYGNAERIHSPLDMILLGTVWMAS